MRSRLTSDRESLFDCDSLFSSEWALRTASYFDRADDVKAFFKDLQLICLEFGADGYQPFVRRVHESIVIGMRCAALTPIETRWRLRQCR